MSWFKLCELVFVTGKTEAPLEAFYLHLFRLQVVSFHDPLLLLFGGQQHSRQLCFGRLSLNLIPDEALYESLSRLRGDFPSNRKRTVKLLWDASEERRDGLATVFVDRRSRSNAEGCC